ncbi:unnamed protein product, partial [marine sediment metagenome]
MRRPVCRRAKNGVIIWGPIVNVGRKSRIAYREARLNCAAAFATIGRRRR